MAVRGVVGTVVATVAVIAIAIATAIASLPATRHPFVLLSGAAYLAVALGTAPALARGLSLRIAFALQIVLGSLLIVASNGVAGLAITPTISGLVLRGSIARGLLVGVLFLVVIAGAERAAGIAPGVIAERVPMNVSAVVFVVAFTGVMRSEERARAESERLARELGEANERLRAYASRVEDVATEKERNRIARDIHDGLGHSLTVVSVQLEAARVLFEKEPTQALGYIERAQTMTRQGLSDVRASVAMLREPRSLLAPLSESLAALVEDGRDGELTVTLSVEGEARSVTPPVRATLFRAAQEGLTNVRRHAHAATAHLRLAYDEDAIELTVTDDGVGAADTGRGFGLAGIRERAVSVGGSLDLETAPGSGTTLRVRVPA